MELIKRKETTMSTIHDTLISKVNNFFVGFHSYVYWRTCHLLNELKFPQSSESTRVFLDSMAHNLIG